RHAVWASALLGILALTIISILLPAINLEVLPESAASSRSVSVPAALPVTVEAPPITSPSTVHAAFDTAPSWDWTQGLLLFWALGSCIVVFQSFVAAWALYRLKANSRVAGGNSWMELLGEVRKELS